MTIDSVPLPISSIPGGLSSPEKTALVIIDVQNDFCASGGFYDRVGHPLDGIQRAVERIEALLPRARAAGVRPIFVRAIYDREYVSAPGLARHERMGYPLDLCLTGSWGAEFFRVVPEPGDAVITKHRYSAFIDTELNALLRGSDITHLILCGVATNVCVESTARDGYMLDYHILLITDASATYDQSLHDSTLENVRRSFGVVTTVAELVEAWQAGAAGGRAAGETDHERRTA